MKGRIVHDPTPTASTHPRALAAFQQEMACRKIDLSLYKLYFSETPESYRIFADYRFTEPGLRGSDPVHKSYTVEVSRADFSVTGVYLSR